LLIYKSQGNEYRLTPFKIKKTHYCKFLAQEATYHGFYNSFKIPTKCPIKKANYTGEFDVDFSTVPPNFDGKFKFVRNYYYQQELIGTCDILAEIYHYFE
jgi:hypothetical protein